MFPQLDPHQDLLELLSLKVFHPIIPIGLSTGMLYVRNFYTTCLSNLLFKTATAK